MGSDALTGKGRTVCVTGASGFIGSHIVKQLLERGYSVRGTVRDATETEKYKWLHTLADGTPGSLELFSADLTKPGSFDEALGGCEYVCHVAAAVKLKAKDPQKEIVDVSVDGTRNVFDSILKAKAAKRVVLTSSVAAIIDMTEPADHVYTEEDWHSSLTLKLAYNMGKTLSERLAWKVYEEQPKEGSPGEDAPWRFELAVVNPSLVLGKLLHKSHATTSIEAVKQLMDGTLPMLPAFYFSVVHVLDVALAHILCLEKESAKGRYIVSQADDGETSFSEIAGIIREKYPNSNAPTLVMPTWLVYFITLINPVLSSDGIAYMARHRKSSSKKARDELGIKFRSPQAAILDAAESLVELKAVPDPEQPKSSWLGIFK